MGILCAVWTTAAYFHCDDDDNDDNGECTQENCWRMKGV